MTFRGTKLWMSIEKTATELAIERPFLQKLRQLRACAPEKCAEFLDVDHRRQMAWWGKEPDAPRIIEKNETGEIRFVELGLAAAGVTPQDLATVKV